MTARVLASIALVLTLVLGCHGSGAAPFDTGVPTTDAGMPATTGRYIPLAVGATWTWTGDDSRSGLSGTVSSTVEALDTLTGTKSGISAFRVHDSTLSGSVINWQQDTGTSTVRHREQFFDTSGTLTSDNLYTPGKLRLDESPAHTTLGATWTETFTDASAATTTITVQWTVEAVSDTITVPAGTFTCLRVHSVESGTLGYDSTFWYARNVGKVKETGTETRNLVGYAIP